MKYIEYVKEVDWGTFLIYCFISVILGMIVVSFFLATISTAIKNEEVLKTFCTELLK